MHCNPRVDALFSHVVSQWTYSWLALPRQLSQTEVSKELEFWQLTDFQNYIEQRWDPSLASMPWMRTVIEKQLSLTALATLVYEQVQKVASQGAMLIDFYHSSYPSLLRNISDPPNLITALGSIELFERDAIAIVGSRKASAYALAQTHELALKIARRGQLVVSGGALGCDMAGHLGVLDSGFRPAPTVVVFAGGLAQFYPRYHQNEFAELQAAGALFVSERLWDYPARPFDFPVRNRIISGMAKQLLVMQAGERSGAKVSAVCAIDQGREVFVLVHPDGDVRATGSQLLIEEGAIPFESSEDFLNYSVRSA